MDLVATGNFVRCVWSTGAQSTIIRVGTPGTYSVTVVDSNGCKGMSAPIAIVGSAPLNPSITATFTPCRSELDAQPGFVSYLWSTGETTRGIVVHIPGSYTVTVTDAYGCTGTAAIAVDSSQFQTGATSLAVDSLEVGTALDFGRIDVFTELCRDVTLRNVGAVPLTIDSLWLAVGRAFRIDSAATPLVIPPGEGAVVRVCCRPIDSSANVDTLMLNGRCTTYSVPVAASGSLPPQCGGQTIELLLDSTHVSAPYPNPASGSVELRLNCYGSPATDLQCVLIDPLGRVVANGALIHGASGLAYVCSVAALPAQIYVAVVTAGRRVWRLPVAVVR